MRRDDFCAGDFFEGEEVAAVVGDEEIGMGGYGEVEEFGVRDVAYEGVRNGSLVEDHIACFGQIFAIQVQLRIAPGELGANCR